MEPHILQRLMPDKRIYHFQTPRTTPTNGLKSDFFWWFMRFVRVPLMKVGQIGPTFLVPEKTVNFFRVKPAVSSFTLKMRKSHKKLARVYAYTHAYTQIRDGGGKYAPPPVIIGLKNLSDARDAWLFVRSLKFQRDHQ